MWPSPFHLFAQGVAEIAAGRRRGPGHVAVPRLGKPPIPSPHSKAPFWTYREVQHNRAAVGSDRSPDSQVDRHSAGRWQPSANVRESRLATFIVRGHCWTVVDGRSAVFKSVCGRCEASRVSSILIHPRHFPPVLAAMTAKLQTVFQTTWGRRALSSRQRTWLAPDNCRQCLSGLLRSTTWRVVTARRGRNGSRLV